MDWDIYTNTNFACKRYLYDEPLCYQLFYETDNFNSWSDIGGIKYILMYLFKWFNLHMHPEPGFTHFYRISKIIFLILLLILFYIIYRITKK